VAGTAGTACGCGALDEHVNDLTALKLAAAHERIDRGEPARPSEYDLISGLAGLGVYHLVRHGPAGSGMTAAVLDYLVALAEPVCRHGEPVPGWWSGTGPAGTAPTARPSRASPSTRTPRPRRQACRSSGESTAK
jgi:hypothetical protein